MAKTYGSAAAFRQALEERLRTVAAERNVPLNDLRLKLLIERLLARLFANRGAPRFLKGGFAMDLRYRPRARTTKDVDISIPIPASGVLITASGFIRQELQQAVDSALDDYLMYRIGAPKDDLPNAPLGGARFPVVVRLAGTVYGRFHIDVGFDPLIGTPETLTGDDLLDFIGVPPATAVAIPRAQQFAEKLHAYTYPWTDRSNTRVKDLVDLVLLVERGELEPEAVKRSLHGIFDVRQTHSLPSTLLPPPADWREQFGPMAMEAALRSNDLDAAFASLVSFWEGSRLGAPAV